MSTRNLLRSSFVLAAAVSATVLATHQTRPSPQAESAVKKTEPATLKKTETKGPVAAAADKKLEGHCSCGSVKWTAKGNPEFTFNCHCSLCRRSGGAAFVAAAAFKPENVSWVGEMAEHKPANSKVPRRFCAKCHTYVAEDARPVLGVFALPLGLTDPMPDKIYAPTQHIFYDSRVINVSDKLPKFMQMPGSAKYEE